MLKSGLMLRVGLCMCLEALKLVVLGFNCFLDCRVLGRGMYCDTLEDLFVVTGTFEYSITFGDLGKYCITVGEDLKAVLG
ncbi:hypothetical protein KC19_7G087000 [Ceratodon purpureus]|uniref:Uncharacterized protein n=1 Tax=Ceratodon purpureus TaxID=3225 RepID=A0A8T0H9A3_CERPU|nr:hypothetical protein KC19_7G087000 [Ceratodon purpureus]